MSDTTTPDTSTPPADDSTVSPITPIVPDASDDGSDSVDGGTPDAIHRG